MRCFSLSNKNVMANIELMIKSNRIWIVSEHVLVGISFFSTINDAKEIVSNPTLSRETLQCDDKSWFGITIILFSKCFLFIQIVTLDFEKFISQKPSVPITSVTPTAGPPSHPPQDAIQHLLSTEAYLQEQIKELDAIRCPKRSLPTG